MSPQAAVAVWDALMAAGRIARNSRDRLAGAQHGAHRGRFPEPTCRFRVRRTDDPHRPRPLAAGAWARLAGRFRQGALHGPPRLARRTAARARAGSWWDSDMAGNKPAHNALLYTRGERQARDRQRHARPTWSPTCKRNIALAMVDAPYFQVGIGGLGGDLLEPRTRVGASHVAAEVVERPFFAPERRRATPPADF